MKPNDSANSNPDRRNFLGKTAVAVAGSGLVMGMTTPAVHAAGDDSLKVGLIGCGGRGSGAAINAMKADENVKLTALCDIFQDRMENCQKNLGPRLGDQFAVTKDSMFAGFDGYKNLIDSDVDVVLLCTTPHFRPMQLAYAVEKGKHVFCEKPVAVDGPGVRSVLDTSKVAEAKGLALVSGLCWRYDLGVRATVDKIKEGAIGDIVTMQENYLTGTLWHRGNKPEWSEMEYQIRNWLYYTWLSGDFIAEQHIHSLDKAMWLMDDVPPLRCVGQGGREVRDDEKWGNVFDHFAVSYEWENGVRMYSYCRQMSGCSNDVEDYIFGTKGQARILRHSVEGEETWRYRGPKPSMYDQEHKELFASIRAGSPINNGKYMSYSTLLAIMGREAAYTGQTITWEQALNSKTELSPEKYEWGKVTAPTEIAVPGKTKLV